MKRFITNVKDIFSKDTPKLLGRWNLDYCVVKLDKKINLTNEDHCGPCGQYNVITKEEKEKEKKIIDLE
jgi:hypothetical protein